MSTEKGTDWILTRSCTMFLNAPFQVLSYVLTHVPANAVVKVVISGFFETIVANVIGIIVVLFFSGWTVVAVVGVVTSEYASGVIFVAAVVELTVAGALEVVWPGNVEAAVLAEVVEAEAGDVIDSFAVVFGFGSEVRFAVGFVVDVNAGLAVDAIVAGEVRSGLNGSYSYRVGKGFCVNCCTQFLLIYSRQHCDYGFCRHRWRCC